MFALKTPFRDELLLLRAGGGGGLVVARTALACEYRLDDRDIDITGGSFGSIERNAGLGFCGKFVVVVVAELLLLA